MSTDERTINDGQLSNREYERVLSTIRIEARKLTENLNALEEIAQKLATGGHPAPANVVRDTLTAMRVCMTHLREVFKIVDF